MASNNQPGTAWYKGSTKEAADRPGIQSADQFDARSYLDKNQWIKDKHPDWFEENPQEAAYNHYAKWGARNLDDNRIPDPLYESNRQKTKDAVESRFTNPQLPDGAGYDPVMQFANWRKEMLGSHGYKVDPTGANAGTSYARWHGASSPQDPSASGYSAFTIDPNRAEAMNAAQGTIENEELISAAQGRLPGRAISDAAQGRVGQNAQVNAAQGTLSEEARPDAAQNTLNQGAYVDPAQGQVSQRSLVDPAQGDLSQDTIQAYQEAERLNEEAELDDRATVQAQFEDLTSFEPGETPEWAKGAIKEAEQRMAARGLGQSSIASGEITGAVLKSAMPIAQQDAQIWNEFENRKLDNKTKAVLTKAGHLANMDKRNLSNRQQAAMQNAQSFLEMDMQNLDNHQQAAVQNAQSVLQNDLQNLDNRQEAELQKARAALEIDTRNLNNRQQAAVQNAKSFLDMRLQNLNNRQQSELQNADAFREMSMRNLNNRQQAAVRNAQAFLDMDMQNLNNEQQAAVIDAQGRQQQLLSNQSARNAAQQLNIQSENEMKQFTAELATNVEKFNTAQRNTIRQFNAGESNAMAKFNSELENMRDKFNVKNRKEIDQFNVQYLRQLATRNTERQNKANYTNSQNLLNISNTAMANMVTMLRDRESFAFKAAENQKSRATNRAIAALNNQADMAQLQKQLDSESESALYSALGGFVGNIGTEIVKDFDFSEIEF